MSKSIRRIASVVALGTLLSKSGGMIRQLAIAGAFGISKTYDAFNYAYIIPGFFLVILGGINGPFHNAMVATLSNKNRQETFKIFSTLTTTICTVLLFISIILFLTANPIIRVIGPGLSIEAHKIAVIQFRIMTPIATLAGLIGLSFGSLNAKEEFLIPSISPLISSLTIVFFISMVWIINANPMIFFSNDIKGSILIASATLTGALLQYLFQIPSLIRKQILKFKFSLNFKDTGFIQAWGIILPATFSTGMLQINVFTDLLFASQMIGAAAALTYANFLVQAPLGLVSNTLLLPILPTFSKLRGAENRNKLIGLITKSLIFSSISMISLGAIFASVSEPITELIYGRGAFDSNAIEFVSHLLIAYGIGMPVYLCRDLLVRIFYSIDKANIPFKVSIIGIILNLIFDWFLVGGPSPWGSLSRFNLGASGLVYATVGVNLISSIILIQKLNNELTELPIKKIIIQNIKILFSGVIASYCCSKASAAILWPKGFLGLSTNVIICSVLCFGIFCLTCHLLKIKEINQILSITSKKIIHL